MTFQPQQGTRGAGNPPAHHRLKPVPPYAGTGGTDFSLWFGTRIAFPTVVLLLAVASVAAFAFQSSPAAAPSDRVADPFALGWFLEDTNGDGIADVLNGKIVVPASPSAAQNAAAANLAARAAFGATGLTPPVVVSADQDQGDGPRIWVGQEAVPASAAAGLAAFPLATDEGGVFAIGGNLAVIGANDGGLLAAADSYSARAPYVWRPSGEKLAAIADVLREVAPGSTVELAGLCYLRGKAGVHRAYLRASGIAADALKRALEVAAPGGRAQPGRGGRRIRGKH